MYERVVHSEETIGNFITEHDISYISKCVYEMGLADRNSQISSSTRAAGVKRFLARMLGLSPDDQNKMLNFFGKAVEHVVNEAKREGTYDDGIVDLKGHVSVVEEPRVLINDENNTKVTVQQIRVDRGVSFLDALKRYSEVVFLQQGQRVLTREKCEGTVLKWNQRGQIVVSLVDKDEDVVLSGKDVIPLMEKAPWNEDNEDEAYQQEEDEDEDTFESNRKMYDLYIERQRLGFYSRERTAFGRVRTL